VTRHARRVVGIALEVFTIALGVYLLLPRIAGFELPVLAGLGLLPTLPRRRRSSSALEPS